MAQKASSQWVRHHGKLLLAVSMDPRAVGRRIAEAREAKGWTQLTFALEADVSPSTVQRWESGKLPPVRELLRVARILEVDADQLVEPPGERGRPQDVLLREVAAGVDEILKTNADLVVRVQDLQERVARIEGQHENDAASQSV